MIIVSKATKRHCVGTVQSQGGRVGNVKQVGFEPRPEDSYGRCRSDKRYEIRSWSKKWLSGWVCGYACVICCWYVSAWQWQDSTLRSTDTLLPLYERAIRNCPWSVELWIGQLQALEHCGRLHHQIVGKYHDCSICYYTVFQKNGHPFCFCYNFVYCQPICTIFGTCTL